MKFPVEQVGYCLRGIPHLHSLVDCIKWWVLRKNKNCRSFCLTCKWWFRCQEDIEFEKYMDTANYATIKCSECEYYDECVERTGF